MNDMKTKDTALLDIQAPAVIEGLVYLIVWTRAIGTVDLRQKKYSFKFSLSELHT